ncbi:hypothetical protein NDU88_007367 [Pleurodeles waltl]|uniref:Uncharacterized protein n=1 Tax=Pleurodeles waltl TaxID=8319 RepID=A0AAV7RTY1_PLEWA|nr:hypothetical protein NDU88_007367 [Pleurodeles waltl]
MIRDLAVEVRSSFETSNINQKEIRGLCEALGQKFVDLAERTAALEREVCDLRRATEDNREVTVSKISSTDSCSEIEYACTALEQSSFSDTAIAGEVTEWGKDDIFIEEEVEAAVEVSTSLKRKEKEGDDTEETGLESNDSRD